MAPGGHLMLGLDASLSHVYGVADYMQHIAGTPIGEVSAFARAFGGTSRAGGYWKPEFGATAGVEVTW